MKNSALVPRYSGGNFRNRRYGPTSYWGPVRVASGWLGNPVDAQPPTGTPPETRTAAQVELTVPSDSGRVKQENTIYGVPLLKSPTNCTRVAAKPQSSSVRKGKQLPDRKDTCLTAKSGAKLVYAHFCPVRMLQRGGRTARAIESLVRFWCKSKAVLLPVSGI